MNPKKSYNMESLPSSVLLDFADGLLSEYQKQVLYEYFEDNPEDLLASEGAKLYYAIENSNRSDLENYLKRKAADTSFLYNEGTFSTSDSESNLNSFLLIDVTDEMPSKSWIYKELSSDTKVFNNVIKVAAIITIIIFMSTLALYVNLWGNFVRNHSSDYCVLDEEINIETLGTRSPYLILLSDTVGLFYTTEELIDTNHVTDNSFILVGTIQLRGKYNLAVISELNDFTIETGKCIN